MHISLYLYGPQDVVPRLGQQLPARTASSPLRILVVAMGTRGDAPRQSQGPKRPHKHNDLRPNTSGDTRNAVLWDPNVYVVFLGPTSSLL